MAGTKQRSQPLLAAIRAYHSDHGTYPQQLAELVPDYITEIPSPGYHGCEWAYVRQMHGTKFILGVHPDSPWISNLTYYSSLDEWVEDTK